MFKQLCNLRANFIHFKFISKPSIIVITLLSLCFFTQSTNLQINQTQSTEKNNVVKTFNRIESNMLDGNYDSILVKKKKKKQLIDLKKPDEGHFNFKAQKSVKTSILIGNVRKTSKKMSLYTRKLSKNRVTLPNIMRKKSHFQKQRVKKDKVIWANEKNYQEYMEYRNTIKAPRVKPKIEIDSKETQPKKERIKKPSFRYARSKTLPPKAFTKENSLLDLPIVRLGTMVLPEPSFAPIDEIVDISKKIIDDEDNPRDIDQLLDTETEESETESYRKINVVWDRSILMRSLEKLGMTDKFKMIHSLIFRVDMALKKYIQLTSQSKKILNIPKNFKHCENRRSDDFNRKNFSQEILIEADLIIFLVGEFNDNDVLATAAACKINDNNRAYVGRLYLNLKNLDFDYNNYFKQRSDIMVVFHEVLHIIGFEKVFLQKGDAHNPFKGVPLGEQFGYLKKLENLPVDPIDQDFHWNAEYFGNDLMSPTDRIDNTITIYTLEYLDSISPEIKTDRSALPNNFMLDEITSFNSFFAYECKDDDAAPDYSVYCDFEEVSSRKNSCDRSRLYKTTCGRQRLANNCFSKKPLTKYACSNVFQSKENIKMFETYGNTSRCFNTQKGGAMYNSMCLDFEVNDAGVLIKSEGFEYQCTETGQVLTMKTEKEGRVYELDVVCPDAEEMRELYRKTYCPFNCYGNGFCSNGKCSCFDGFSAKDYCREKTVSSIITRFTRALD